MLHINLLFVGIHWKSNGDVVAYRNVTTDGIDTCGPANLLSAGYALWLVLVPAVACVLQHPGSVFLFGRSNFYRFAPELGIADGLGVVALLVKALRQGHRWRESVVAVFVVREGIGRGELWWRADGTGMEEEGERAWVGK